MVFLWEAVEGILGEISDLGRQGKDPVRGVGGAVPTPSPVPSPSYSFVLSEGVEYGGEEAKVGIGSSEEETTDYPEKGAGKGEKRSAWFRGYDAGVREAAPRQVGFEEGRCGADVLVAMWESGFDAGLKLGQRKEYEERRRELSSVFLLFLLILLALALLSSPPAKKRAPFSLSVRRKKTPNGQEREKLACTEKC